MVCDTHCCIWVSRVPKIRVIFQKPQWEDCDRINIPISKQTEFPSPKKYAGWNFLKTKQDRKLAPPLKTHQQLNPFPANAQLATIETVRVQHMDLAQITDYIYIFICYVDKDITQTYFT